MMTAEMTLQTEQASLQALQQSPRLPFYVEELRSLLAREKQQRQAFYAQIQEDDKAEFINGEVIYQSPVKLQHNIASMHVLILLHTFVSKHGLGFVGHEKIMISLSRNDYEPDVCYFRQEKVQKFTPRQMQFPAPDLVVEVLSDSTTKIDRGVKFTDYAAHGVGEYWLVDPEEESVEQYRLEDSTYVLVMKGRTGQIESFVLPGLVIAAQAIFDEEAYRTALAELVS